MNWRGYLLGIILATLVAWFCLGAILFSFEPTKDGLKILILFYLSLFIGVSGILTLIGFAIRRIRRREEVAFYQMNASFRQGLLLAIILVGSLILQSKGLLRWWSVGILVGVVGLVEYLLS